MFFKKNQDEKKSEKSLSEEPTLETQTELTTNHAKEFSYTVIDVRSGDQHYIQGSLILDENIINKSLKEICALTTSGQFFVSIAYKNDPTIISLLANLKYKNQSPKDIIYVNTISIKEMYEKNSITSGDPINTEATKMQRTLLQIIQRATKMGASDIHLVSTAKKGYFRFRVDGSLMDPEEGEIRSDIAKTLQAAAFAMAETSDPSYQELSVQGARIISNDTITLPKGIQAIRLQWDPTVFYGRALFMRLLYESNESTAELDKLGYSKEHLKKISYMRSQPQGVIVFSGPTGSGKSTALKNNLDRLIEEHKREINVLTVEDPPEYIIEFAHQIPITGATEAEDRRKAFNKTIAAAMRSDPDVIMIGEIRDEESSKLAFESAMTGHQVWTSLHANTALGIIERLRDLGVPMWKMVSPGNIVGLISQRLVRRLCPYCKVSYKKVKNTLDPYHCERLENLCKELERDPFEIFYPGNGCQHCQDISPGHRGRTAIAEIIVPNEEFLELVKQENMVGAKKYWFDHLDGDTLQSHGFEKVLAGEISPLALEKATGTLHFEKCMNRFKR